MPPQQSLADRWKAKQQPLKPTQSLADRWKAKQTPNPPPTSPTEKPGFISRAWDASLDLAEGFAGQLYMGMNPGAGSIPMAQGLAEPWIEAYQDTTRHPHARFGRAASKMIGLNPDAIEQDWEAGNYGGVAGGIAPAAVAGIVAHKVGGYLRGKALANSLKVPPTTPPPPPPPDFSHNVPRGEFSPYPNPHIPAKPQPFDVSYPPSPYDVPRAPEPPPGPSSVWPQRKLPPIGGTTTLEKEGMGAQDLYPRGPRGNPPLLGLGAGDPYKGNRFFFGEGGEPVVDINDPNNATIYGRHRDLSQQAQGFVNNDPVFWESEQLGNIGGTPFTEGFNPNLRRPGTTMPMQGPITYAPPVEPVVAPAKAGKVGRRPKNAITPDAITPEVLAAEEAIPAAAKPVKVKPVQPVKPPKPVPIGKYTDDMLIERVKNGTATPEIQAEIAKRIAKKEKAAAAAPIVEPSKPTAPVVEPVAIPDPVATLPKVEPVAVPDLTPVPDVTPPIVEPPIVEPPVAPPVKPPKAAKEKVVTVPKSVINRLDKALAEAKTAYKEALKDVKGYRSPMKDESMDPKWNEFNDKLNAARKALTAATKAKVKAVNIPEPVIEPVVEPVKAAPTRPTLPKVEPIQGLDLSGHTREQLIELARTADDATSLTIRQELKTRREAASRKAGSDLPSGLGSFQDMPRLLKQEFDDWRVLKNLPENQAVYERFIQETGRASKMYARYASRPAEQKLPPVEPVEIPRQETPKPVEIPIAKAIEPEPVSKPIVPDVDQSVLKKEEPEFDSTDPDWSPDLSRYSDRQFKDYYEAAMRDRKLTPEVAKAARAEAERRTNIAATKAIEAVRDKPTGNAAETWKTLTPGPVGEYGRTFIRRMRSDVTKTLGHGDPLTREDAYARNPEFFTDKLAPVRVDQVTDDIKRAIKAIEKHSGYETVPGQFAEMQKAFEWGRQFIAKLEDPNVPAEKKYFDIIDEIHKPNREGAFTDPFYDYDKMLEEIRAEEAAKRVPDVETEKPSLRGMPLVNEAEGFKTGDRVKTKDAHGNPVEGIVQRIIRSQTLPWLDVYIPDKRVGYQGFNRRIATSEALKIDREVGGWIPQEMRREGPSRPTEQPLPKVEPVDLGPLSKLTTEELADAAKVADSPEEVAAIRKEVARRRNERGGRGTSIPSGLSLLEDAPAIIKKEFDQWRVLKELPENQKSFEQFLRETSRLGTAATRTGVGQTVELSLEGMEQFERDRANIGSSAKQPDWGAQSKLSDRPREPVLRERFQQGIPDPKREDLKGLSFREIVEKGSKETKDRLEADKIRAAEERGRQAAIEERQRAKTTAQIVRREDRLRARTKKLEEKKAKVAEKKAVKKAAEIPPADVTDVPTAKITQKTGYLRFMKANPALKAITDKMIKWRSANKLIGKGIRNKFKNIADIPKDQIIQFQEALGRGEYPEVRKFFDDLHDDLTARGIEMGEKENYLPQLWDNNPKEVRAAFGDKKMSEKASFQFRSFIEDYKTGIQDKNLTPKMSPLELMEWYGQRANKLIADNRALKELKAAGYLSKKSLAGMEEINPRFGGTFRGYHAEPKVRQVIENYLESAESRSGFLKQVSKGAGKIKSSVLSAGVPFVPGLTFHGMGMMARAGLEHPKRLGTAIKYGLNPRAAARMLEKENAAMVKATQEHGFSTSVEHIGEGKYFTDESTKYGIGKAKKAFNWFNDKQQIAFEKNLFEKMIPALKWDAWKANHAKLIKKGLSEAEAGAKATEITDSFYSGKNIDLLYKDKIYNTIVEAVTLAPNWLRSTVDLGIKVPTSTVKLLKNPKNPVAQKYAAAGARLAASYAAANLLQKALTGKYMVENSTADIFNLQIGEDSDGRPRSIKLFGTAADFAKLPLQFAMAMYKEGGGGELAASAMESRASPLISAGLSYARGENYKGETNLFGTRDRYGNPVPAKDRAINTLLQGLEYGPPQISAPINWMAGRMGTEETLARLTEMPIKYGTKRKPKKSSSPLTMPGLQGLPSIPRMR